jgi:hypothetical protein
VTGKLQIQRVREIFTELCVYIAEKINLRSAFPEGPEDIEYLLREIDQIIKDNIVFIE